MSLRRVCWCLVALAATLLIMLRPPTGQGSPLAEEPPAGHFYTQANGQGGEGDLGFALTDEDGIPFWREFQRLGGVTALGYPISHRFLWRGTVVQVLQKAVLQWQPQSQQVAFANIFDELHLAGKDGWLRTARSVPVQVRLEEAEAGLTWEVIARRRLAWLDAYPAFQATYFAAADPFARFGLPTSQVEDMGNHLAIRLQRSAMQFWKEDVPWARAGEVTVINGGDLAKEAGLFPAEAVTPSPSRPLAFAPATAAAGSTRPGQATPVPGRSAAIVALDAGHGGAEVGAAHQFADGFVLREKDVNLQVALRAAALLREVGYEVILTRAADAGTNASGTDVNGDGEVNVDDDLQVRVDTANRARAAVLVSIHHNGHPSADLRGTEVYYNPDRPHTAQNRRLAQFILEALVARLEQAGYPTLNRGVKTDASARGRDFYLLGPINTPRHITRASQMPAALGEGLFLTNAADAAAVRRPAIVEAEAQAYAVAIQRFLSGAP